MNTQKTPLVQKLILLMLVLIFGALVLLLVNARKQMEALRKGNGQEAILSTNTNEPADVRHAFPTMRSSKPRPATVTAPAVPATPVKAPEPEQRPASDPVAIAEEQPPTIIPAGTVVEPPEALSAKPGISGRVTLVGVPPPEIVIRFDPTCGKFHTPNTRTQRYVVSADGGLANVLVYISKGLEQRKFPTPSNSVLIDQKGCMYLPALIGAMVNQPIQIRNSDPVLHNVHALPRNSDEFNFAQPNRGQIDERKFSTPELFIKMKCDVHDWMLCYVSVLSHPYFAVTDTNGLFELPAGLPPGKYEVTAAHLRAGTVSQTVVLKEKSNLRLDFRLPVNGKPWRGLQAP